MTGLLCVGFTLSLGLIGPGGVVLAILLFVPGNVTFHLGENLLAGFLPELATHLRAIPFGATTTYGAIARAIGNAEAVRAVGAANGANPIPLVLPCHRVIGTDGRLTGYGGGLPRKEWLLHHEGARLVPGPLPPFKSTNL